MTVCLVLKASTVWMILVIVAIANGIFRENLLAPGFGPETALPVSGITLCVLVFAIAYFSAPFFGANTGPVFFGIGLQWVLMTLVFEFVFGHFVAGRSWIAILQAFNIMTGNLFLVVLLVSLFSPYVAAKLRGFLKRRARTVSSNEHRQRCPCRLFVCLFHFFDPAGL